ncbi:MAG: GNAT family N-acetyltransferase [Candidatus Delongbacteria bacterium]|nr:GNAT family N-acetyltransferase [Candidatus Delongbacteria bacterium]
MTSITEIRECEITARQHAQLADLRNASFPDHQKQRSYYKQLPHARLIAHDGDTLVGQLGIDHRVISVGGNALTIFGVIDVCVRDTARSRGIGSSLLVRCLERASACGIDYVILLADDQRLYRSHGFVSVHATCAWLRIDEFRSLGMAVEPLGGELMIKRTGHKEWPEGLVDFLGYLF